MLLPVGQRLFQREGLRRPPKLPCGDGNQLGHVSHGKVVDLRMADRPDENHAVHPDAAGGLLRGQPGESGLDVASLKIRELDVAGQLDHVVSRRPVVGQGGRGLRGQAVQPVFDALLDGVVGRRPDTRVQFLVLSPKFVLDIGLGLPPDCDPVPAAVGFPADRYLTHPAFPARGEEDRVLAPERGAWCRP